VDHYSKGQSMLQIVELSLNSVETSWTAYRVQLRKISKYRNWFLRNARHQTCSLL